MRRFIEFLSLCFFASYAMAMTPKNAPGVLPPLAAPPPASVIPQLPSGPPITVWTRDIIESLGISNTMKRDFLAHLKIVEPAAVVTQESVGLREHGATERARSARHLRLAPTTSVVGTAQATADALDDIEPSIITNRFGTTDRTTIAFTKFDVTNTPFHYWTSTTDFTNFAGAPAGVPFQLPSGTNRSSDPMLSENAYASNGQPNAFPKRTYCIGSSYDINAQGNVDYDELDVWYTDDPGTGSWSRVMIDSVTNPLVLDKPSITTSWDTTHGTLGYTYAAAVAVNMSTNQYQIRVYRQASTLGFTLVNGQFIGSPGDQIQSPIVVVDNSTGDVYLLWLDWTLNTINIARSTNMGTNFGPAVSFSPGTLVNANGSIRDVSGTVLVRATSTLMARPNAATNSIGVVWHQYEADGAHTDVFFNSFALATQTWSGEQHLGHTGQNDGRDQWNPALDPASDGTYVVTWYDKREDPNNDRYLVYAEKINSNGTPADVNDTVVYNALAPADPALLQSIGGIRYLGDYQDIWEWFGTWASGTIYIDPNGEEDVYAPRIQP